LDDTQAQWADAKILFAPAMYVISCHISHIMPKVLHLPAASTLRYSLISFGQVLRYSLDGKDAQTIPQADPHGAGMCRVLPGGSTL
jgi:hypothetical protein